MQPNKSVVELIAALGYTDVDGEMAVFVGDYFVVLASGAAMIEEASMTLKMTLMSEEERKKQELIIANRKAYLEKMKADKEYKETLQKRSQQDRAVKAAEKQPASKPNTLKFGANMKKFEPPAESKGG